MEPITAGQRNYIKKKILKCLTEDFEYGKRKDGKPLKRKKVNAALFDKQKGFANFNGTDLEMIMNAVVLGLSFCMDKEQIKKEKGNDFYDGDEQDLKKAGVIIQKEHIPLPYKNCENCYTARNHGKTKKQEGEEKSE